jgi:hypothetical protein
MPFPRPKRLTPRRGTGMEGLIGSCLYLTRGQVKSMGRPMWLMPPDPQTHHYHLL